MLQQLRRSGLLWPTLMTVLALPILIGLGTWQLERRTWKEGLLTRLHERRLAAPVDVGEALRLHQATGDVEYMRVTARGHYRHDLERYLFAPDPAAGAGFHVITPLVGPDASILLVNRGYVSQTLKDPARRADGQTEGEVAVTGLVRVAAERTTFTPESDPQHNVWYWRDVEGLRQSIHVPQAQAFFPFLLEAEGQPGNPGGWPSGGVTILSLPNRHLEYALTWFGLAGTLTIIYAIFAVGRLRRAVR